jgi:hypothetical protein
MLNPVVYVRNQRHFNSTVILNVTGWEQFHDKGRKEWKRCHLSVVHNDKLSYRLDQASAQSNRHRWHWKWQCCHVMTLKSETFIRHPKISVRWSIGSQMVDRLYISFGIHFGKMLQERRSVWIVMIMCI